MDLNLKGKNALVCGGSSGIGKASAIELSRLGANVTLLARNPASLADALTALNHLWAHYTEENPYPGQ